jgi:nucleolar protein 53
MPALHPPKASTEAPATYKQPSRKGKKAWRKNVDVTEVTKGLEELNDEIVKGFVLCRLF